MENGYAVVQNDGELQLTLDMKPFAVRANCKVLKDINKICIQSGPIVYCAESVDNGENLHTLSIPVPFSVKRYYDDFFGLPVLEIDGFRYTEHSDDLYAFADADMPEKMPCTIKMIPFSCFANRGESDMLTWIYRAAD